MNRIFFCARKYADLKDANRGGYGCSQKGRSAVRCQDSTLPKEAAVCCLYFVMTAVKSHFLHLVGRMKGRLIGNGFRGTQSSVISFGIRVFADIHCRQRTPYKFRSVTAACHSFHMVYLHRHFTFGCVSWSP